MWQLTVERRPRSGKPPPPPIPSNSTTATCRATSQPIIQSRATANKSSMLALDRRLFGWSKARQGKESRGEGTREKGGGGGESAAPSSQNLRRRPLVENRIPIAPSGEKRYSCLKALRSNCLASPLCETLCVKLECHLEDVMRAPSGAVIFSRISVFVAKKHSRSILQRPPPQPPIREILKKHLLMTL